MLIAMAAVEIRKKCTIVRVMQKNKRKERAADLPSAAPVDVGLPVLNVPVKKKKKNNMQIKKQCQYKVRAKKNEQHNA
jgi:hypothetical protein